MADDRQQELLVTLFSTAKHVQFIVLVALNLGSGVAHHHMGNIFGLEALAQGDDRLDGGAQLFTGLDTLLGLEAVIAVATVLLLVGLAKVVQQRAAAANRRLGIVACLEQQLLPDLLLSDGLALHELLELVQVLAGIEGDALALAPVTAGTAGLLVVTLQTLGDIIMDDKPHIGLVDTHTEGDGRYNHVNILAQESVLIVAAHRALHACMIGQRLDIVEAQHLGQFLDLLAAQAVDNARFALVGLDELDDLAIHVLGLGTHLIIQVGTVER